MFPYNNPRNFSDEECSTLQDLHFGCIYLHHVSQQIQFDLWQTLILRAKESNYQLPEVVGQACKFSSKRSENMTHTNIWYW